MLLTRVNIIAIHGWQWFDNGYPSFGPSLVDNHASRVNHAFDPGQYCHGLRMVTEDLEHG